MRFTLASGNWPHNWMGWEGQKVQTGVEVGKLLIMQLGPQPWGGGGGVRVNVSMVIGYRLFVWRQCSSPLPLRDREQLLSFMALMNTTEDSVIHSIHL